MKDIFEGPYVLGDTPVIKRVATPTLAALKRDYTHLCQDTVADRKFDFWLSNTKCRGLVTLEVDPESITRQIVADIKLSDNKIYIGEFQEFSKKFMSYF